MKILEIINSYIIYLYLIIILAILVCLVNVFKNGLLPLSKALAKMADNLKNINKDVEHINSDLEKIEFTLNNSLPLFIDIAFIIFLIKAVYKDYSETIPKKRSLFKSVMKQYEYFNLKYHHTFSPNTRNDLNKIFKQLDE